MTIEVVRVDLETLKRIVSHNKPTKGNLLFESTAEMLKVEKNLNFVIRWEYYRDAFVATLVIDINGYFGTVVGSDFLTNHINRNFRDLTGINYLTGIISRSDFNRQKKIGALLNPTNVLNHTKRESRD